MTDLPDLHEIEIETLATLMRWLEEHHHKLGWRKRLMTVYAIFDSHRREEADIITKVMGSLGPAVMVGRYGAQPMIVDRMLTDTAIAPWKALSAFAQNIAFADPGLIAADAEVEDPERLATMLGYMRELLQLPGYVAFAACYEGHGLEEISPALAGKVMEDDIETLPGAREGRMLIVVDAGDHVHKVHRVRGHRHVVEMFVPLRGDTTNSLRKIMDLAMNRLPATQQEADARYNRFQRSGGNVFQASQRQPTG